MKRLLGSALLAGLVALLGAGCSANPSVECKVTLDGQPLEGASVSFIADGDAKSQTAIIGQTDASGVAKMTTSGKSGVPKGKYKVLVTKTRAGEGFDADAAQKDPMTAMKDAAQKSGTMPGKGAPAGGPRRPNNILPEKYGDASQTPLSAEVPSSGPIALELKSNG